MSNALTTTQKHDISVSISRDILAQAWGVDSIDSITVEECISEFKRTDENEMAAIKAIKDSADHSRGKYIETIKVKEPENWAVIIEKRLGVKRTHANKLSKFFRDSFSFEALVNLKALNLEKKSLKENLRIEDLSFPDSAASFHEAKGITKSEKASLQKEMKLNDATKEEIEIATARVNLVRKAESNTKMELDRLWKKIEYNGLSIRDDGIVYKYIDGEIVLSDGKKKKVVIEKDTALIKSLQIAFDKFSNEMKEESLRLSGEPVRSEKFKKLGWTAEDEELYQESRHSRKTAKKVDKFFTDNYRLWKKSYKSIAKILHPDTGGSEEAQALMNAIGEQMAHASIIAKYDKIINKYNDIKTKYDEWRVQQTESISISLEDIISSIEEE